MSLPTYPRPTFGPSGLGLRFGLAQRGLYIALGAPLLWAWRVGMRAHFSNPINNYPFNLTFHVPCLALLVEHSKFKKAKHSAREEVLGLSQVEQFTTL